MGRYVKKFPRVGMSLGPSEERGFSLWVGYAIADCSGDLSALGLTCVDDWDEARIIELGVITFVEVTSDDSELRAKLGLK